MTEYSSDWRERMMPDQRMIADMEYFHSLYPQSMKELQRYVNWQCDRMDYVGSPIYDEFPDRMVIDRACEEICRQLPEELLLSFAPGSRSDMSGFPETMETEWLGEDELTDMEQSDVYESQDMDDGLMMEQRRPMQPPQRPPRPPQRPPRPPMEPPRPPMRPPRPPMRPPRPPQRPPRPPMEPPRPPHRPPRPPQRPPFPPTFPPPWWWREWDVLPDVVRILLINEIRNRRCRMGLC